MLKLKARTQHYRLMAGKMSRMTPLWVSLLLAMGRTGFTSWKTRWERGIPLKIWEALLVRYFPFHTRAFFSRPRPLLQEIKNLKTIGCQVSCCVTDNAYNMAGARREIVEMQQEEISNLQQQEATPEREKEIAELRQNALIDAYGCSAHLLNLWCVEPPLAFFLSISAGKM